MHNQMIPENEKFIREIERLLQLSMKYYDKQADLVPPKDIRLAFFGLTGNVLHSLLLFSVASIQTLYETDWWIKNYGRKEMTDLDKAAIRHLEAFSKHSFLIFFLSRIETLMRKTIPIVAPEFNNSPNKPFYQIYEKYLKTLSLSKYMPLYDVCRIIRNSIHNNGVFLHKKGKNQTFLWRTIDYEFKHKSAIDFMTPENIFIFFEDLTHSMNEIVDSEALSKHSFIEDKYY